MALYLNPAPGVTLTVAILLAVCQPAGLYRLWMTIYMDDEENCLQNIRNDDMNEGDMYVVKSDGWRGDSPWTRRPAECYISTNFGDRLGAVNLVEWWCEKAEGEPFLDIYDDCNGEKTTLLSRYDCHSSSPATVFSTGTCITLYHYRGHTKWRYHFSLEVVAKYEVIAFPAGGIAAIIIACIVVGMVVAKVACVISGFENRIPAIPTETEDIKQTLLVEGATARSPSHIRVKDRRGSESGTLSCEATAPTSGATGGTAGGSSGTGGGGGSSGAGGGSSGAGGGAAIALGGSSSGPSTAPGSTNRRAVMLSSLKGHTLMRATTRPLHSPGPSSREICQYAEPEESDAYATIRSARFTGGRGHRILKL